MPWWTFYAFGGKQNQHLAGHVVPIMDLMIPRTVCIGVFKQTMSSNWGKKEERTLVFSRRQQPNECQSLKGLKATYHRALEYVAYVAWKAEKNKLSNHLTFKVFEVKVSLSLTLVSWLSQQWTP